MATRTKTASEAAVTGVLDAPNGDRERIFNIFRQWGYLEADLDPLGFLPVVPHPDLRLEGEIAEEARRVYSGTVGAEFMHITDPERRSWIQERMEGPQPAVDQQHILDQLIRADLFEQVLQQRYLGNKRFSLEGVTALIPLVDEVLETSGQRGAINLVMGMSHRGRLNVIVHVARRAPPKVQFAPRRSVRSPAKSCLPCWHRSDALADLPDRIGQVWKDPAHPEISTQKTK
jgi:2-oxoglutarate dehydrogenase E1 component